MEQDVQTQVMDDADHNLEQDALEKSSEGYLDDDQPSNEDHDENQAENKATDGESKDHGGAFAAVKKDARTKGYRVGYQEGYERARQEAMSSSNTDYQQTSDAPNHATQQNQYTQDPSFVAFQQNQQRIGQSGLNKYKDKWISSIQDLDQEVRFNPDLGKAVLMAHDLPNSEDIIYKLATDEKFRNDLLDKNERNWSKELLKAGIPSDPPKPQKVVKVANDPVPPLKSSPTNGGGHMTMSEKVKKMKLRIKGLA